MFLSPLSVIKYHGWGSDSQASFGSAARDLLSRGGFSVFFKGVTVVMLRDASFGVVYELIRGRLRASQPSSSAGAFGADVAAAAVASLASAPLNYCRNIIYAAAPDTKPPSISQCMIELAREARSTDSPLRFLESRLYFGWGTARVAVGMGIGQLVFEHVKRWLSV
jgi:hypothetical protein